jgi:hypothetical protein
MQDCIQSLRQLRFPAKVAFDQSNVPGTGYIAAGPVAVAAAAHVPIKTETYIGQLQPDGLPRRLAGGCGTAEGQRPVHGQERQRRVQGHQG